MPNGAVKPKPSAAAGKQRPEQTPPANLLGFAGSVGTDGSQDGARGAGAELLSASSFSCKPSQPLSWVLVLVQASFPGAGQTERARRLLWLLGGESIPPQPPSSPGKHCQPSALGSKSRSAVLEMQHNAKA